ncbi:MAG: hypothetical protein F6K35_34670, partial [Okeania sp. SIO2H7]|nr:hypothetical protein [Okeania sp. SIO2H7]
AFFLGRAVAEGIYEQLGKLFSEVITEISKFDAEQREKLRQFSEKVLEHADREAAREIEEGQNYSNAPATSTQPKDLQAIIDELRAEVAKTLSELRKYRSNSV